MQKEKFIKTDQNQAQITNNSENKTDEFYYKKNAEKCYDNITINQILERVSLGVSEEILGIFERSGRIYKPPFLVITTQKILSVQLPLFKIWSFSYGEHLWAIKKTMIAGYQIKKGILRGDLILNLVDGSTYPLRGINKNIFHSITQALDSFQKGGTETTTRETKPSIGKPITHISEPFFCQVCETSRPATTPRMKCESCNRFVCLDCFSQMANLGKTNCPMCEGKLYSQ